MDVGLYHGVSGSGWSRKVVKTFNMSQVWHTNTSESNLKLPPSLSSTHITQTDHRFQYILEFLQRLLGCRTEFQGQFSQGRF